MDRFEPEYIASQIKIPVEKWPGNCYAIAVAIERALIFPAHEAVYGIWHGPISPESRFAGRKWTHHGWLQYPSGSIIDPTRWVFEACEPYIYQGVNDHYDVAGDQLRMRMHAMKPKPRVPFNHERIQSLVNVPPAVTQHMAEMLEDPGATSFSKEQLFYIANAPMQLLEPNIVLIYTYLRNLGFWALIPIDNRHTVFGKLT